MKNFQAITLFALINASTAFVPNRSPYMRRSVKLSEIAEDVELFTFDLPPKRIEGGGTLETYQFPPYATRCEYFLKTDGRPMQAEVQLWNGPIRKLHTLNIDNQDGQKSPWRGILNFKPGPWALRVQNTGPFEFPLTAGVRVATPERAERIGKKLQATWDGYEKTFLQGGDADFKGGAVKTFEIPPNVDSVNLMAWSTKVGKKGLKVKIQVQQGPNNPKQIYHLQCGGSTQPYSALILTPGEGWTIRAWNVNVMEYPTEIIVIPYETSDYSGGSSNLMTLGKY